MKLILTTIMMMSLIFSNQSIPAQHSNGPTYDLLIGTYTKPGNTNGIYVYTFDAETGDFSYKNGVGNITNPSFLTISKDRRFVYAVSEVGKGQGSVSAFSYDAATRKLEYLNSSSAGGDGPCHLSVDDSNKFVFVGNYGGGSLAAIPIKADGSLSPDIQAIQHQGSSIHANQDQPRVHATVVSPDNNYLLVPDLGTDKVNLYYIDYKSSDPLIPADPAFVQLEAGSGPRHFAFHPNNIFGYLIQELTGHLTAFSYQEGQLETIQTLLTTPKGYTGNPEGADIHVSPDGKFLYTSLRAKLNEIVIYAIGMNGTLTYVDRQPTFGGHPRNFVIDPSGNYLLVGNAQSDEVVIFKRDQETGLLSDTGKRINLGSPVCLKFVTPD